MLKTTVLMKFERKHRRGAEKFPMPQSLFSDGFSSHIDFLPENVVCWITTTDVTVFPGRMHHRYNLVVALKKQFIIRSDGLRFTLSPDQAILVFPTQCHHFERGCDEEESAPSIKLHITFILSKGAGSGKLNPLRNRVLTLDEKCSGLILKILETVYLENEAEYSNIPLFLAGVLNRFLELSVSKALEVSGGNNVFLRAVDYIRSNYTSDISVKTVAEAIGISPSRLSAVFKDQTRGVTIGLYISKLRFYRAVELLATSDMSIAEISRACGFRDQFSFSRRFKQHETGHLSPTVYRDVVRKRGLYGWKTDRCRI